MPRRGKVRKPLHELRDFWLRVDTDGDGCWEWQGAVGGIGYGAWFPKGKHVPAHRYAYMKTHGVELTRHQCVCHKCDNPACVRPDHLFVGSHGDNARDRARKGRQGKIQRRSPAVTIEEHKEIVRLAESGVGTRQIAAQFGRSERGVRLLLAQGRNCERRESNSHALAGAAF